MSPEQVTVHIPAKTEDIYGLGAMMIRFFTGLPPVKFDRKDMRRLCESIEFFTGDKTLAEVITKCLDNSHACRPELPDIKCALGQQGNIEERLGTLIDFKCLIKKSLEALASPWFAAKDVERRIEDEIGITYLFSIAGICRDSIPIFKNMQARLPGGLLRGTWGMAVAFCEAIKAGLLPDSATNRSFIQECLSVPGNGFDAATGIAGQGTAILHCRLFLEKTFIDTMLDKTSWNLIRHYKCVKNHSLFYGKAGIALCLLVYSERYKKGRAFMAAEKILQSLSEQKIVQKLSPWLAEGLAGLAFVNIRAFEVTKDKKYQAQAEKLLRLHPTKVVSDSFGFADGLAGLGQVYLEAHRVFEGGGWKERADWIASVLAHTYYQQQDGGIYWLENHSLTPTADLITGNTGIIHFLLRCTDNSIPFPLFNNDL
jgi:hypothetical protein